MAYSYVKLISLFSTDAQKGEHDNSIEETMLDRSFGIKMVSFRMHLLALWDCEVKISRNDQAELFPGC